MEEVAENTKLDQEYYLVHKRGLTRPCGLEVVPRNYVRYFDDVKIYDDFKLDPELKERWVENLRSGEFRQCKGFLRGSANYRCCIGVLADQMPDTYTPNECTYLYQDSDEVFFADAQLPKDKPLPNTVQAALATANDSGIPFERIAEIVERQL